MGDAGGSRIAYKNLGIFLKGLLGRKEAGGIWTTVTGHENITVQLDCFCFAMRITFMPVSQSNFFLLNFFT